MIIGRVTGNLWATAQHSSFDKVRLVLVTPWDPVSGKEGGNTLLAVDTVGSGIGDEVLIVYEGGSVRKVLGDPKTPAEAMVIAIIDRIDFSDNGKSEMRSFDAADAIKNN